MKTDMFTLNRKIFAVFAACLIAAAATAYSQSVAGGVYPTPAYGWPNYHSVNGLGFYLAGDAGISVLPDFNSSRFGGPARFSADPGARFSLEPGYDFLSTRQLTLGAEFETGAIYNRLNSINVGGTSTDMRGDYYQVPFLGNLVLKFGPDSWVKPYIGVGGGGVYSHARIHGDFDEWAWSDQTDPAVQAMAGVRFQLTPFADLGLGYKFLMVLPGDDNQVYTHAVLASFNLAF
ncbi:exported hypothetical protein [Verrucomicrobia bacterium]|nr:exported hypothetical protein [Verrucomicrobiota bacterium]